MKEYIFQECKEVLNNNKKVFQDCIIAKEYRGARYYKPNILAPTLVLARYLFVIAMQKSYFYYKHALFYQ